MYTLLFISTSCPNTSPIYFHFVRFVTQSNIPVFSILKFKSNYSNFEGKWKIISISKMELNFSINFNWRYRKSTTGVGQVASNISEFNEYTKIRWHMLHYLSDYGKIFIFAIEFISQLFLLLNLEWFSISKPSLETVSSNNSSMRKIILRIVNEIEIYANDLNLWHHYSSFEARIVQ